MERRSRERLTDYVLEITVSARGQENVHRGPAGEAAHALGRFA
jgi:hypothetical protein